MPVPACDRFLEERMAISPPASRLEDLAAEGPPTPIRLAGSNDCGYMRGGIADSVEDYAAAMARITDAAIARGLRCWESR